MLGEYKVEVCSWRSQGDSASLSANKKKIGFQTSPISHLTRKATLAAWLSSIVRKDLSLPLWLSLVILLHSLYPGRGDPFLLFRWIVNECCGPGNVIINLFHFTSVYDGVACASLNRVISSSPLRYCPFSSLCALLGLCSSLGPRNLCHPSTPSLFPYFKLDIFSWPFRPFPLKKQGILSPDYYLGKTFSLIRFT